MRSGYGFAPGKVILLGEHSVVYGRPAIAASIDRYVSVRVLPIGEGRSGRGASLHEAARNDERLQKALDTALNAFDLRLDQVELTTVTDLPIAVGLGSSAALSVALIRALAVASGRFASTAELCRVSYEMEKCFHGTPSGIDSTTIAMEGLIEFTREEIPQRHLTARPLPLVIAMGREPRSTGHVVARVRQQWQDHPAEYDAIFDEIAALTRSAIPCFRSGDLSTLGELMNVNHELLQQLMVSTPELDTMVELARTKGALGAKLTGGGGGGSIICLADNNQSQLIETFERSGWSAFATLAGAEEDHDADDDAIDNQDTAESIP